VQSDIAPCNLKQTSEFGNFFIGGWVVSDPTWTHLARAQLSAALRCAARPVIPGTWIAGRVSKAEPILHAPVIHDLERVLISVPA
jgi:hypothetical protein